MEPEFTFLVTYECPRCHAALEAKTGTVTGWLRCPECGRASLPPEHMRAPRPEFKKPFGDDVLIIGPEARGPRSSPMQGGIQRVVLATSFLVALTLTFISVLDQNELTSGIFGFATIGLFGLLVVAGRRRR